MFRVIRTSVAVVLAAGALAAGLLESPTAEASPLAPYIQYDGQTRGVLCVQVVLQMHAGWGGTADGVYGPQTRQGVIQFQRYFGLGADGIVGRATGDLLMYIGTRDDYSRWFWEDHNCYNDVPTST
jgi:N-acetylmuramoyl-L-alanine amidase